MTAWCWGFGWGDEAIPPKTRSMMNLAMLGALGRLHEWEVHCRGALNNGVSREEIRAIIHAVGIYAGVPMALECSFVLPAGCWTRPTPLAEASWSG